ncbi:MAG: glycosyltransferase family A protein [Bryobacteraceae bacterium]|nr:glycosyltransferase family A protein [Bryobacteraceae bacterium]
MSIDVLIPTCGRPAALAVTLCSLLSQTWREFRVIVSDQTDGPHVADAGEVRAAWRVLQAQGNPVEFHHHLPNRGMAEQRQFLLEQSRTPFVLYLDDDVILEAGVLERLLRAIRNERCGFVGAALTGLSYLHDVSPQEQHIEFWNGPVQPDLVQPHSPAWNRYKLHNAANVYHLERRLALPPGEYRTYKVACIGGCVLYDAAALRALGAFEFWRDLPPRHCGEDVLAQLRVMARFGGCGLLPSGVYHLELPTTIPDRSANAPLLLPVLSGGNDVRSRRLA